MGIALVILCTIFTVFQQDNDRYIEEYEKLKYTADEVASSGAAYKDLIEYSYGKMVFNYAEGNKAVSYQIKALLKLDDSFNPLNTYWRDKISYKVYYYDHSNIAKIYENGSLVEEKSFSFNYLFQDKDTGYTKLIVEPTVIVTINAGKPRFRLTLFDTSNIDAIRSTAYEWKGRN